MLTKALAIVNGKLNGILRSQLRRNMAIGALFTAISAAVMAISYSIYLKRLGYEQYGLWLILSTVIAFSK